jgi:hypothetical protein
MPLENKLRLLEQLYDLYTGFADQFETACRKFCCDCCTCNVTLTTLEGYFLISELNPDQKVHLQRLLERSAGEGRFQPRLSTNELAHRCIRGETIPEDVAAPCRGVCPLLDGGLCSVYRLRPFGCRCFISKTPCAHRGSADADEFVVTLNTVFLQALEHIDADGCSGNLTDVLLCLSNEKNRLAYRAGQRVCRRQGLIENRPMTAWMVPPVHRTRVAPIIAALRRLCSKI